MSGNLKVHLQYRFASFALQPWKVQCHPYESSLTDLTLERAGPIMSVSVRFLSGFVSVSSGTVFSDAFTIERQGVSALRSMQYLQVFGPIFSPGAKYIVHGRSLQGASTEVELAGDAEKGFWLNMAR